MSQINFLEYINPILFPDFSDVSDEDDNELIILRVSNAPKRINLADLGYRTKTEYEGYENHFHVFDNVADNEMNAAAKITELISENLLNKLHKNYPSRRFVLYIDINFENSIIIRFHQLWPNEERFYDVEAMREEGFNIREIVW